MARAKALVFHGNDSQPRRKLFDVPRRDLNERDIARLTDEQYENATGGERPLYTAPKPRKPRKQRESAALDGANDQSEEDAGDDEATDQAPDEAADQPA